MNDSPDQKFIKLMQEAQNGCKSSYHQLLQSITPILSGFIHKRIGQGSDHDDILQDTLIAIHKSSHTFNTERSFTRWMYAIADHKVKDYLRAYYRKSRYQMVDLDEIENFTADDETLSPIANELESKERLNNLLDGLPEKQRRIIFLMKIEGFSAKEVANQIGMSETNVKVTAHRGYKLLREQAQNATSDTTKQANTATSTGRC